MVVKRAATMVAWMVYQKVEMMGHSLAVKMDFALVVWMVECWVALTDDMRVVLKVGLLAGLMADVMDVKMVLLTVVLTVELMDYAWADL